MLPNSGRKSLLEFDSGFRGQLAIVGPGEWARTSVILVWVGPPCPIPAFGQGTHRLIEVSDSLESIR
jgi:hypothetical protein